jgi:hypothetical protein
MSISSVAQRCLHLDYILPSRTQLFIYIIAAHTAGMRWSLHFMRTACILWIDDNIRHTVVMHAYLDVCLYSFCGAAGQLAITSVI